MIKTPSKIGMKINPKKGLRYYIFGRKVYKGTLTFWYKETGPLTESWTVYHETQQGCSNDLAKLASKLCNDLGFNWEFIPVPITEYEKTFKL
jgi:hypothetical protein